MATHHSTPPHSGGERPRLPSAQAGPVTQAVLVMRSAELRERLEAHTSRKPADPHISLRDRLIAAHAAAIAVRPVFEARAPR